MSSPCLSSNRCFNKAVEFLVLLFLAFARSGSFCSEAARREASSLEGWVTAGANPQRMSWVPHAAPGALEVIWQSQELPDMGWHSWWPVIPGYNHQAAPYRWSVGPSKNKSMYWAHGDNVGPTICQDRMYVHRGNAIVAFGPAGSRSRAPVLPVARAPSGGVVPDPLSEAVLRERLEAEIQKILDAGHAARQGAPLPESCTLITAWNFMFLVPELADYLRQQALPKVQEAVDRYTRMAPYWMAGHNEEVQHENGLTPLHQTHALFQAKAWILRASRDELAKFLDSPLVPVGDLYYLQNLIATLEAPRSANR